MPQQLSTQGGPFQLQLQKTSLWLNYFLANSRSQAYLRASARLIGPIWFNQDSDPVALYGSSDNNKKHREKWYKNVFTFYCYFRYEVTNLKTTFYLQQSLRLVT